VNWADRYIITSVKGRIWSRPMVRTKVLALGRRLLLLPANTDIVDEILDDDAFMTRGRGEIPARVVEAVHEEARLRAHAAAAAAATTSQAQAIVERHRPVARVKGGRR
jgi:hypothetical protein